MFIFLRYDDKSYSDYVNCTLVRYGNTEKKNESNYFSTTDSLFIFHDKINNYYYHTLYITTPAHQI